MINKLNRLMAKPCPVLQATMSLADPVDSDGMHRGHGDTYSVVKETRFCTLLVTAASLCAIDGELS